MSNKTKVAVIFGTRPEAIKLGPVIHALQADPAFETTVIVSAQHRDMLDQVLDIFGIEPDFDLDIMTPDQTLSLVTARCLVDLQGIIQSEKPDIALVQGDTTTAMASALAFFYQKLPVGHVEAGLRTSDKYSPYPEEINRRIVGVLADLNFCPTPWSRDNLLDENVPDSSIHVTGNTVVDALQFILSKPEPKSGVWNDIRKFQSTVDRTILVTAHRRESFGKSLEDMCLAVKDIVERFIDVGVIFPVHPNPNVKAPIEAILGGIENVFLISPVDYPTLIHTMSRCYMVLTDSGGIQEEAPSLDKPVLVMREKTERPEGIEAGVARLVGTRRRNIVREVTELLTSETVYRSMARGDNPYGDGKASERIIDVLKKFKGEQR